MALQVITIHLDGKEVKALIDSGCSRSVVLASLVSKQLRKTDEVMIANGTMASCYCDIVVDLLIRGISLKIRCMALKNLPYDIEMIY